MSTSLLVKDKVRHVIELDIDSPDSSSIVFIDREAAVNGQQFDPGWQSGIQLTHL